MTPIMCEDTGEVCWTYGEYLKSKHWAEVRARAIEASGRKEEGLQVHHLTYGRIGREKMEDLKVVTAEEHQAIHDKEKKERFIKSCEWGKKYESY